MSRRACSIGFLFWVRVMGIRCGVGGRKWFAVVGAQAVEGDAQQPVPHLRAALVGDLDGVAQ